MNKRSTLCVPVAKCSFVRIDVAMERIKTTKTKTTRTSSR